MPRAIWKGRLTIKALNCEVALHAAASQSERVSFHTLNRATGNRVRREYVDRETGEPVAREDQVKGYEIGKDRYVVLEPEDIAAAVPEGNKTLAVEAFLACDAVDTTYFDKPYFLGPAGAGDLEAYALIRDGLRATRHAALARALLFRRWRTLLIRPDGAGLIAHTLRFDYEVRPAEKAFARLPDIRIEGEMLDLAKHIIATKSGAFDPAGFDDRYDAALADLVKAKIEGRAIKPPKRPRAPKVVDLMAALRASAGDGTAPAPAKGKAKGKTKPPGGGAAARSRKAAKSGASPRARRKAG